jgi:sulfonate transport system substrate-binding protein
VKAHRELTEWIQKNPAEAQALVQKGLSAEVRRPIKLSLIESSWKRLTFSSDLNLNSIEGLVTDAKALGFIRGQVDLSQLLRIPPQ